ncbi:bifunctional folylpolyglutamate synthase/dihydrofolate synthase [Anaerobacillus sp. CMMVII]|uniref:bifunctional folylpolyglutamate synthase/dihydrofolate synthase n=1 Tax=Anaerobacillus sp. CMMVII TaxID=2755588 RepID=UPI0021B790D3|nr:folylpolyglutamate synthase/dihydrofolate synthase family protein [Anaerobacillus sp. CMMVII]MCT8137512.1 bifunctional folylpolyglutamate synthase/dihydrofolate synthase [Anaerobacillus sp. CMMVII]
MISYEEACDIVFSAKKFGISLGLDRMELMLGELGNPEQRIPAIHIAGTNGKGSTLTYLASIFMEAGYRVGTYTSPAINKLNDKIKIDGIEISNQEFSLIIEQLKPIIEKVSGSQFGPPTEFELLTAVAFQYFATVTKPDIIIIETGLGGRLDSTNIVTPIVSIITNIGHDHMDLLGNTIKEVAFEKAGIIKEGIPIVSGCKQPEAIGVMIERSNQLSAPFFQLGQDFLCESNQSMFSFQWKDIHYSNLKTGMLGKHQQENAALALMTIQELQDYAISELAIRNGLMKAKIANRIEMIKNEPTVILDGGHNPEGMEALANTLKVNFSGRKIKVLFCAMKDKDIKGMLQPLSEVATEIVLTSFSYDRVMDPKEVNLAFPLPNAMVIENWLVAYRLIEKNLKADDVFVITGSLYFLSHVRNELKI